MYETIVEVVHEWIDFDVKTNFTDGILKIDLSIEIPLKPFEEYIQSLSTSPEPSE